MRGYSNGQSQNLLAVGVLAHQARRIGGTVPGDQVRFTRGCDWGWGAGAHGDSFVFMWGGMLHTPPHGMQYALCFHGVCQACVIVWLTGLIE